MEGPNASLAAQLRLIIGGRQPGPFFTAPPKFRVCHGGWALILQGPSMGMAPWRVFYPFPRPLSESSINTKPSLGDVIVLFFRLSFEPKRHDLGINVGASYRGSASYFLFRLAASHFAIHYISFLLLDVYGTLRNLHDFIITRSLFFLVFRPVYFHHYRPGRYCRMTSILSPFISAGFPLVGWFDDLPLVHLMMTWTNDTFSFHLSELCMVL